MCGAVENRVTEEAVSLAPAERRDALPQDSSGPADTVRREGTPLFLPADSLAGSIGAERDTVVVSAVYGPDSFRPVGGEDTSARPVASAVGYQLLTLLLLLTYLSVVFRAGGHMARMLRMVWSRREGGRRGDSDMPGAEVQVPVLACGLLMWGIAAVKAVKLWGGGDSLPDVFAGGEWLAVPLLMAALLVVMGVQAAVLTLAGRLTFGTEFVRTLGAGRFALFASMTVTGAPAVVLAALSDGVWAEVAIGLLGVVAAIHILWYAVSSFLLFVEQKVSILLWILYLCAVEAMPFGILAVGLWRCWPV